MQWKRFPKWPLTASKPFAAAFGHLFVLVLFVLSPSCAMWVGTVLQDTPNELVKCAIRCRAGGTCYSFARSSEGGSSQRIPSQSKMQNNCLCRFNNLHKRHKNRIERKGGEREMTVKCETYNNYKANQVERHPDAARGTALSRLHIMQSSQGYIRTVCRDASHYRATRVIYSLSLLFAPCSNLPFQLPFAHTHRRRYP